MRHCSEEELVLHHYGESVDREEVERHLAACESCRGEYEILRQVLAAADAVPVPPRPDAYPEQVWRRVEAAAHRARSGWISWFAGPRLALAGTVAALLVVAFLAGRLTGRREAELGPLAADARERILLAAVGDHLERSQRVLIELVNTDVRGGVDLSGARPRARDLAADNRVYRRTAEEAGQPAIAGLLDDLERVLLELANAPETMTPAEFAELRRRIEGRGLLIKVRFVGEEVRERVRRPAWDTAANEI